MGTFSFILSIATCQYYDPYFVPQIFDDGAHMFSHGSRNDPRIQKDLSAFPQSCKANCDKAGHTIEFLLKNGETCPEVYNSKSPPLNIMVKGKDQCNLEEGTATLCSYCYQWNTEANPRNSMISDVLYHGQKFGVGDSEMGKYSLQKMCTYKSPKKCTIWSLIKGECSDCS